MAMRVIVARAYGIAASGNLVTLLLDIEVLCCVRESATTGPVTATSRQSALERVRTGPWPGRHPVSGRESSHRCIWAARVAEYATMPTQTAGRGPIAARSPPGRAVAITDVAWKRPNGPTHATSTPSSPAWSAKRAVEDVVARTKRLDVAPRPLTYPLPGASRRDVTPARPDSPS